MVTIDASLDELTGATIIITTTTTRTAIMGITIGITTMVVTGKW